MKIEDLVPDFEACKKLAKTGLFAESTFVIFDFQGIQIFTRERAVELEITGAEVYPAPLLEEILNVMPESVSANNDTYRLKMVKNFCSQYGFQYHSDSTGKILEAGFCRNKAVIGIIELLYKLESRNLIDTLKEDTESKKYRLFGGNNFEIIIDGEWKSIGHVVTGTLEDKFNKVPVWDGPTQDEFIASREVWINVTVASTDEEQLLFKYLEGHTCTGYYDNGIVENKEQRFYMPLISIKPMARNLSGSMQTIELQMLAYPHAMILNNNNAGKNAMPGSKTINSLGEIVSKSKCYAVIEKLKDGK